MPFFAALLLLASFAARAQDGAPTDVDVQSTEGGAAAAFRNQPVRCGPGSIEYFAGKTLGEVFGEAWSAAPASTRFDRPRALRMGAMRWPRGLGQDGATVVTATLVGADGRAIHAEALCASVPAIAKPAMRAAMDGSYTPAKFDGAPGMGIVFNTWRFRLRNDEAQPRSRPSTR